VNCKCQEETVQDLEVKGQEQEGAQAALERVQLAERAQEEVQEPAAAGQVEWAEIKRGQVPADSAYAHHAEPKQRTL